MAIALSSEFPNKTNPPSAEFPYGSARNTVTKGDGTGTPWDKAIANDSIGFHQALLSDAGITPSGDPDNAVNSQYLAALKLMFTDFADIASMELSQSNFKVGQVIRVSKPMVTLEVINPDGTGIPLANGMEARGVKQSITLDSVSDMKSQPLGLFVEGTTVNLRDYYSGWATVATREPYSFSGVVVSDASVVNVRGKPADNIGDHSLGGGLNFLASTKHGYVNRVWGCRPNQDIDDNARLQAMFDAPKRSTSVEFKFSGGSQYLNSSSQLSVSELGKVVFKSDGGDLIYSGTDATKYGLLIEDCNFVKWKSLDFNLNRQTFKGAVRIYNIRYQVKIDGSNFVNFADQDGLNFECAQQTGFEVERINKNPANISNNSSAGLQVVNCSFSNEAPSLDTSFDYDNNFCGGTGVKLMNDCEYWRITNCGFFGNCIGLWVNDAANGAVVNCEFQEILGVVSKSLIATGIPEGAGLYVAPYGGGGNNGKLTVSACKFNHNWGFGVRSAYTTANRPVNVANCEFIANSFIAINISGTSQCSIKDNYFERAHNYLNLASYPWGGFGSFRDGFIYLGANTLYTTIEGNRANDLPNGVLAIMDTGGAGFVNQKIANNTVSSSVGNPVNKFFNATPAIHYENHIMG